MNSIEALKVQIESQHHILGRIAMPEPEESPIFVGSGDSFAAALLATSVSGRYSQVYVPAQIRRIVPSPASGSPKKAFIISVSGRTKDNISAAISLRAKGFQVTAITSSKQNSLAKVCDRVIELESDASQAIQTAGTLTFLMCFLKCAAICGRAVLPKQMKQIFNKARRRASEVANNLGKGKYRCFFLLGDHVTYPVAVYGALKINEVIGEKAFPYYAKEFEHAPIFSIKSRDAVVCLEASGDCSILMRRLRNQTGVPAISVRYLEGSPLESALFSVFTMQVLALELALRRGMRDCYFLSNKKILGISTELIY